MKPTRALLALLLTLCPCGFAKAAIVITATQTGNDVVFETLGGTLNLNDLTKPAAVPNDIVASVNPTAANTTIGANSLFDIYNGSSIPISGPASFGTGGYIAASSSTGSFLAIDSASKAIGVPQGYVSGDPLSGGTTTFSGQTLVTMGLVPGSYVWSWGSGINADSITTTIVPVPEPAALFLGCVGFSILLLRRRGM